MKRMTMVLLLALLLTGSEAFPEEQTQRKKSVFFGGATPVGCNVHRVVNVRNTDFKSAGDVSKYLDQATPNTKLFYGALSEGLSALLDGKPAIAGSEGAIVEGTFIVGKSAGSETTMTTEELANKVTAWGIDILKSQATSGLEEDTGIKLSPTKHYALIYKVYTMSFEYAMDKAAETNIKRAYIEFLPKRIKLGASPSPEQLKTAASPAAFQILFFDGQNCLIESPDNKKGLIKKAILLPIEMDPFGWIQYEMMKNCWAPGALKEGAQFPWELNGDYWKLPDFVNFNVISTLGAPVPAKYLKLFNNPQFKAAQVIEVLDRDIQKEFVYPLVNAFDTKLAKDHGRYGTDLEAAVKKANDLLLKIYKGRREIIDALERTEKKLKDLETAFATAKKTAEELSKQTRNHAIDPSLLAHTYQGKDTKTKLKESQKRILDHFEGIGKRAFIGLDDIERDTKHQMAVMKEYFEPRKAGKKLTYYDANTVIKLYYKDKHKSWEAHRDMIVGKTAHYWEAQVHVSKDGVWRRSEKLNFYPITRNKTNYAEYLNAFHKNLDALIDESLAKAGNWEDATLTFFARLPEDQRADVARFDALIAAFKKEAKAYDEEIKGAYKDQLKDFQKDYQDNIAYAVQLHQAMIEKVAPASKEIAFDPLFWNHPLAKTVGKYAPGAGAGIDPDNWNITKEEAAEIIKGLKTYRTQLVTMKGQLEKVLEVLPTGWSERAVTGKEMSTFFPCYTGEVSGGGLRLINDSKKAPLYSFEGGGLQKQDPVTLADGTVLENGYTSLFNDPAFDRKTTEAILHHPAMLVYAKTVNIQTLHFLSMTTDRIERLDQAVAVLQKRVIESDKPIPDEISDASYKHGFEMLKAYTAMLKFYKEHYPIAELQHITLKLQQKTVVAPRLKEFPGVLEVGAKVAGKGGADYDAVIAALAEIEKVSPDNYRLVKQTLEQIKPEVLKKQVASFSTALATFIEKEKEHQKMLGDIPPYLQDDKISLALVFLLGNIEGQLKIDYPGDFNTWPAYREVMTDFFFAGDFRQAKEDLDKYWKLVELLMKLKAGTEQEQVATVKVDVPPPGEDVKVPTPATPPPLADNGSLQKPDLGDDPTLEKPALELPGDRNTPSLEKPELTDTGEKPAIGDTTLKPPDPSVAPPLPQPGQERQEAKPRSVDIPLLIALMMEVYDRLPGAAMRKNAKDPRKRAVRWKPSEKIFADNLGAFQGYKAILKNTDGSLVDTTRFSVKNGYVYMTSYEHPHKPSDDEKLYVFDPSGRLIRTYTVEQMDELLPVYFPGRKFPEMRE